MPETPSRQPADGPGGSERSQHPGGAAHSADSRMLTLRIGHEELVIRQRYEVAGVANDFLIAVWFLIGSVMFFSPDWTRTGTWCFVMGSVELMIRPLIRLSRQLHIQRLHGEVPGFSASSQDY